MRQKRNLGSSGLAVSAIGLGGLPLSIPGRPPREQALETLKAAFEAGIDFVDTADVYCLDETEIGHGERLIAEAIRRFGGGRDLVVATKGGCVRPNGSWGLDARPARLKLACEASLTALGVERIALYQLHAPDPRVRFEESIEALAVLRKEGKIAHVGLTNVSVDQLDRAERIVPIASVQNRLNLADLRAFRDGVLAACQRRGIAFLPYSPLGGAQAVAGVASHPLLLEIGAGHGATAPQVLLAWLLARSPVMIPIPGASRPESARSSAAAMDLALTAQDVGRLDRAFLPARG